MMTETDYQTLRTKLEDDFKKDLDALDRVRRIMNIPVTASSANGATRESHNRVPTSIRTRTTESGKGKLIVAGRSVIQAMPNEFSMLDVHAALEKHLGYDLDKQSARYVLRRAEKEGMIETTKAGVGRRPAEYRKK